MRDSFKQSLAEKTGELEKCMAELKERFWPSISSLVQLWIGFGAKVRIRNGSLKKKLFCWRAGSDLRE